MKIKFYEKNIIENEKLLYAIVVSRYKNKWIFVKHKERDTWEIPAGHREIDEDINLTAKGNYLKKQELKNLKYYICMTILWKLMERKATRHYFLLKYIL